MDEAKDEVMKLHKNTASQTHLRASRALRDGQRTVEVLTQTLNPIINSSQRPSPKIKGTQQKDQVLFNERA